MSKIQIPMSTAFLPSTGEGRTTLDSGTYHIPSTTFGTAAVPTRVVDLRRDILALAVGPSQDPAGDTCQTALSAESLKLLTSGIDDVRAGRVRRLDLNEFDDE